MKKHVLPLVRRLRNSDWKTADIVFAEEHKELKRKGEEWIKKFGGVHAFFATMFAIGYSVVGYGILTKVIPIEHVKPWAFKLMLCNNVTGLFTSIISLLMYIFILTSSSTYSALPKLICIAHLAFCFSLLILPSVWFMISCFGFGPRIWNILLFCFFLLRINHDTLPELDALVSSAFGRG